MTLYEAIEFFGSQRRVAQLLRRDPGTISRWRASNKRLPPKDQVTLYVYSGYELLPDKNVRDFKVGPHRFRRVFQSPFLTQPEVVSGG